jgi:hypothetical protein
MTFLKIILLICVIPFFLTGCYFFITGFVQYGYLRNKVIFKKGEFFNILLSYTPEEKIFVKLYLKKIAKGFLLISLSIFFSIVSG